VASLATLVLLGTAAGAQAEIQPVRLAAPADCRTNPTCAPGLRDVYGLRVDAALVPLAVADAGVAALDDGVAQVAVAFTSSPSVSRPDVLALRDDKHLLKPDHVVPVVRASMLRSYGARAARDIETRVNAASALIATRLLRQLNQQVADGRMPEAVGGQFVDANGLGGNGGRRKGPRIIVGYEDFPENETLAHLYAEVLRSAGYRVAVRSVGGFRPEALKALKAGRVSLLPEYARSLLGYLRGHHEDRDGIGAPLRAALAPAGAVALRQAPGENRNVFVMKRDVAAQLGVSKLSDLARYWR
jgi:glycine betaine/choline ABC-type transport system substrate-binding protein